MIISVASGKGGTGKTFVATHLSKQLARLGKSVTYVDADVEEPNGHLFLHPHIAQQKASSRMVPFLPSGSCTGCGNCQSICAFHAIMVFGNQVTVFDELCHGCGACMLVCEQHYLSEKHLSSGEMKWGSAEDVSYVGGTMHVGEARSTPVISNVIQTALSLHQNDDFIIIDSPPGTSCSAVAATQSADLVLLVAEPTRLGTHDFLLAHEMTQAIKKQAVVVINRADLGTPELIKHIQQRKLPLFSEIPYFQTVAKMGAEGNLSLDDNEAVRQRFSTIAEKILSLNTSTGGDEK